MIGVVHHLERPVEVLRRVGSMLKPHGWFVVNEPHPANPILSIARAVRKRIDAKYSADQRELSERELSNLFAEAGYEHIRVHAQGVLSTPFAEVSFDPSWLARPIANCLVDRWLERLPAGFLKPISWNLVVASQASARR